jgi:Holliday junction resolvase RusA-like endonuclease
MRVPEEDLVLGTIILKITNLPMPPSVNSLYFTKGGKRILSSEGRIYKDMIKSALAEMASAKPSDTDLENHKLSIRFDLFFSSVENKAWHSGKSKNRFKKIDVSNRIKVIEDALVEGLGIDDCQFFNMLINKRQSESSEYVNIYVYDLELFENENLTRN